MNKNYYAVIMAGGVGSRFWPMSTPDNPKQFHDMMGTGKSLLQHTFNRFKQFVSTENILVASNEKYSNLIQNQLNLKTTDSLILEPVMRNTAPCILYSALKIYSKNPDAILAISPSDHWVENEDLFSESVLQCLEYCKHKDILLTLGIQPLKAHTGYGYIKYLEDTQQIKKVQEFVEKPTIEKAKKYVSSDNYLWNSGIFIWSAKSIIEAFQIHLPSIFSIFNKGKDVWNGTSESEFVRLNYPKSESISIDYGILEKAENVFVLPVSFDWSDLGTWSSLYHKLTKDKNGNAHVGGYIINTIDTKKISATKTSKQIEINGKKHYIIVENTEVFMIRSENDC